MINKFPRYGINNTFKFDNRMFLGRGEQMAPFSLEFIFTLISDMGITVLFSTTKYNNFAFCYSGSGKYFYTVARTGGASILLPYNIKSGEVYHIVYVCDEQGSHLYVNGAFAAENKNVSYIWNSAGDDGNLYTGYINQNENWYYTANIYSFRIFNYAMIAEQAKRLWNNGQPMLLNLKTQINPIGLITGATAEKINNWIGDLTRNEDGSVTVANGLTGSYLGCAIRGTEGNTNGLKAENLGTYRITMTYMSDKPVQVRDLGSTHINQAFFSSTDGDKKTETHIIQFDTTGNAGTSLSFYIYISPCATGDEFTIYEFKAEQVGLLGETSGENMTTNMTRDTANVIEINGTKQPVRAQHLLDLSATDEDPELLYSGPIYNVFGNLSEGGGNIEKQPDGGWLVNITAPDSVNPDSRPIIRLQMDKAIEIKEKDTIRFTVMLEPTTDETARKQISQVFFMAGNSTIRCPIYTDTTEATGTQYNDGGRSSRDDVALYLISQNYPLSAHFLSMKIERFKKVNNAKLIYDNPYK